MALNSHLALSVVHCSDVQASRYCNIPQNIVIIYNCRYHGGDAIVSVGLVTQYPTEETPGSLNLQYDAAFETNTLPLTYSCGKGL